MEQRNRNRQKKAVRRGSDLPHIRGARRKDWVDGILDHMKLYSPFDQVIGEIQS